MQSKIWRIAMSRSKIMDKLISGQLVLDALEDKCDEIVMRQLRLRRSGRDE
jgi:hypothetical protein